MTWMDGLLRKHQQLQPHSSVSRCTRVPPKHVSCSQRCSNGSNGNNTTPSRLYRYLWQRTHGFRPIRQSSQLLLRCMHDEAAPCADADVSSAKSWKLPHGLEMVWRSDRKCCRVIRLSELRAIRSIFETSPPSGTVMRTFRYVKRNTLSVLRDTLGAPEARTHPFWSDSCQRRRLRWLAVSHALD